LILFESYITVIAGVKADAFGGAMCAFTLAACVLAGNKKCVRATLPEILLSLALLVIGIVSGLSSVTPWSSTILVLVLAASSLGGFWCARTCINTPFRQQAFVWLCSAALTLTLVLGLCSYYFYGKLESLIDDPHQVVSLVLLLSFGPLALVSQNSYIGKGIGILVLGLVYWVLYICGLSGAEAGVLVPMAVLIPALAVVSLRSGSKTVLLGVLLVVVAASAHYVSYVSRDTFSNSAYQAERLEYYSFSWHIAKQHPFLGIGLRTPREEFLNDYQIWHPHYSKHQFAESVTRFKISQNVFLTFMVGLGLPFLVLYGVVLVVLFFRLIAATLRPPPDAAIPAVVILIPLAGALLHLFVMDLLLMPQIAWFFHILLGLIPPLPGRSTAPATEPKRTSMLRATATAVAIAALGIFLGTHPALDPKRLPTATEISAYVKKMPIVEPFFAEPPPPGEQEAPQAPGSLVVNIPGYKGLPVNWGVMCILDNSATMSEEVGPWNPSRLRTATDFISSLAESMPSGSKIAVKSFFDRGPVLRNNEDLTLRVSGPLYHWTDTPVKRLQVALVGNGSKASNNLCAAVEFSLGGDFQIEGNAVAPRLLLITDGRGECPVQKLPSRVKSTTFGARTAILDVLATGMTRQSMDIYQEVAREANGQFMRIGQPDQLPGAVARYAAILGEPVRVPIIISGEEMNYEVVPGSPITLPPGAYRITLPDIPGLTPSTRFIEDVRIRPGETRELNVNLGDGRIMGEK